MSQDIEITVKLGSTYPYYEISVEIPGFMTLNNIVDSLFDQYHADQHKNQLEKFKDKQLIYLSQQQQILNPNTEIRQLKCRQGKYVLFLKQKIEHLQQQKKSSIDQIQFIQQSQFFIEEKQSPKNFDINKQSQKQATLPKTKPIHKSSKKNFKKMIKDNPIIQAQVQEFQEGEYDWENALKQKDQIIKSQTKQIEQLKMIKNRIEKQNQMLQNRTKQISNEDQIVWLSEILTQLSDSKSKKKFLISAISNLEQLKIQKVKLIYRFDPKNLTNFHNYIDGTQHLLILIRTSTNKCFGAYFSDKIQQPEQDNIIYLSFQQQNRKSITKENKAFLFSINNEIFLKRSHQPAFEYSLNYLIIGMNDLVIKQNSNRITINKNLFGTYSSFKNQDGKRFPVLTGFSDNQFSFTQFQIHQIVFKVN